MSGYYEGYSDTQKEVLATEIRRTRNTLFTIAAVALASDLLGVAMLNAFVFEAILIILIVPVIFIGLGFLALKEPLTAVKMIAVWAYTIITVGARAAVMGWLVKAIIIYFLIAGFQHAREAMRIKKELGV